MRGECDARASHAADAKEPAAQHTARWLGQRPEDRHEGRAEHDEGSGDDQQQQMLNHVRGEELRAEGIQR